MRQPEPWQRKGKGNAWYAQVAGVQVRLAGPGATKAEAWAALHAKVAGARKEEKAPRAALTVAQLVTLYGEHLVGMAERGEMTAKCRDAYWWFLKSASAKFGDVAVARLGAHHVQAWLDGHPRLPDKRQGWGPTSRVKAIEVVRLAVEWGRKYGHAPGENPLASMPKPRPSRRELVITGEQADAVRRLVTCPYLGWLLTALRETGCRPGELYSLTADRVDVRAGTWRVTNKTRRKTGERFRTVYLSDRALELSRYLLLFRAEGPLFVNAWGNPWNDQTVAKRFDWIRAKLGYGEECVPYAYRHLYITDCLEKGIPPATVAELVGHSDLKMIMRVYSKLRERTGHLREAARSARA